MRHLGLLTISAAILSFGLTLGAAPYPAEAGKVCKHVRGPNKFCVKSNDMSPNINLGKPGNDGDLKLKTAGGPAGIMLDGDTGNLTNRFSAAPGSSNGVVKAWARINANGTIASCWRCNMDTAQTQRLGLGAYEVDLTPLSTDICSRPRSVVIDGHDNPADAFQSHALLADRTAPPDFSSVFVETLNTTDGLPKDQAFTLIIY